MFNETAVVQFFNNYEHVMGCYAFTADIRINVNETGIKLVFPTPKVTTEKKEAI